MEVEVTKQCRPASTPAPMTKSVPKECKQPKVVGSCEAAMTRWYSTSFWTRIVFTKITQKTNKVNIREHFQCIQNALFFACLSVVVQLILRIMLRFYHENVCWLCDLLFRKQNTQKSFSGSTILKLENAKNSCTEVVMEMTTTSTQRNSAKKNVGRIFFSLLHNW